MAVILPTVFAGALHGAPRMLFIPNEGQWLPHIRYRDIYGKVLLMDGAIRVGDVLFTFPDSRGRVAVRGRRLTSTRINHFVGRDSMRWKRGVPAYSEVVYEDLYPGVDLIIRGIEGTLSLQWLVHPGGDVSSIALKVEGYTPTLSGGMLRAGPLTMDRVRAYQGTEEVEVHYVVEGNVIRFQVGEYDSARPLIIDPVVAFGGLLYNAGVVGIDEGGGYLYVLLKDLEVDTLRVAGLMEGSRGSSAVVILKMDPSLSSIVAGAVLDGSGTDNPVDLAVGSDGVYVAGYTYSSDFPVTPGGFDSTPSGTDGFVVKLTLDLSSMVSGTFLGGSSADFINDMDIASDGIYLTGYTYSSDFPVVSGAFSSISGGSDAFVARLSPDLSSLLASTYLGGSSSDVGYGLSVGADGVYVVGNTYSGDFPVTSGAYDNSLGGSSDGFVSKFSLSLSTLLASTYIGGGSSDYAYSAVAVSDGVYVSGYTSSSNFPTTAGAYDRTFGGSLDAFVTKMDATLGSVLVSTFLGGSGSDYAYDIEVSASGIYVSGYTYSSNFPITSGSFDPVFGGSSEGFVSLLSADLSSLLSSTYVGGSGSDNVGAVLITSGGLYVAGHSDSPDFPMPSGGFDGNFTGKSDGFVLLLNESLASAGGGTFLDSAYVAASSSDVLYDVFYYDGFIYAVGSSSGYILSSASGYDTSPSGLNDVVVLKIDANTFRVVAGTFLGGSGYDDGFSIYVSAGGVYVAGSSGSSDFPVSGGYDATLGGSSDGFIARLSLDLSSLLSSTYLGGGLTDVIYDVVEGTGGIYVTGKTSSNDFPITAGAYDNTYGGYTDAFVSVLSSDLSSLLYSTFLGGSQYDEGRTVAVASDGVYVYGYTQSSDFPTTAGAYSNSFSGGSDVFVSKFSSNLSSLIASTYVGGGSLDYSSDMALSSTAVYITGHTYSTDFPTTAGAYSTSPAGSQDIFVSMLSTDLSSLSASTYLGGSSTDYSRAILLSPDGVYVAGYTYSTDFPVSSGALDETYNGGEDAVVAKLSSDLSTFLAGTFMGGSGNDEVLSMTSSPSLLYMVGQTTSRDFPVTLNFGYPRGGTDMFIFSMEFGLTPVDAQETVSEVAFWTGDVLVLQIESPSYVGYDVYDAYGRLLDRVPVGLCPPGKVEIPLRDYGPGIYIVNVRVGERVEKLRVLIR